MTTLLVPWAFLVATALGAALTWNAYRPVARSGRLSIVSFFAGWLVSELPVHHVFWQLAATALFLGLGALAAWPGWVALGIAAGSWVALGYLVVGASQTRHLLEEALATGLGEGYRAGLPDDVLARAPHFSLLGLARPFRLRHPTVERIADLVYAPHGSRGRLDVYRHRDRPSGCPVLVQIHGGAWVIGSKEQQGLALMNLLASRGWVCVAINYRLSPRATFPDHLVDVKRAIAWVKEHVAEYGGDPGFVVLSGGSAGGHLAALAALTPNEAEYQPGFEERDTRVQACVPFYGVYDFTNRTGAANAGLSDILERMVMKKKRAEAPAAFERASPLSRVNAEAPPFFVLHGTNDTLVPVEEARLFVERLRACSREPVVYSELPGAQHAFEVFLSLRAARVVEAVGRFLAWVYARRDAGAVSPNAQSTR